MSADACRTNGLAPINPPIEIVAIKGLNGDPATVRLTVRHASMEISLSFTASGADDFARAILCASCGAKAMDMR